MSQNNFLDIFEDDVPMVNKSAHISGSSIDFVYIKKALMEEFLPNITVKNIYFSGYYAVRISIQKDYVDFNINP